MITSLIRTRLKEINREDDCEEFVRILSEMQSRRLVSSPAFPGEDWGDFRRIHANTLVYTQALLFRSSLLIEGVLTAIDRGNPFSLALSVRAHLETTAALGYLHRRLSSMQNGNLKPEKVDEDIANLLLGGRHECTPNAPRAINVLSMLEQAEKSVNMSILGESAKSRDILTDAYEYLCEYCHPNFISNSLALSIDKKKRVFEFRHEIPFQCSELELAGYVLISGSIFISLFDLVVELAKPPEC